MTEKHVASHEHQHHDEKLVDHKHHERIQKYTAEQADRARQEKSNENLAKIIELAHKESESANKINVGEKTIEETDSLIGMQHSLKSTAYKRTLANVQQKLSKPARSFSHFTHNPVIDKISEVSSETVARPSGLLGGSICAFLGSVVVVYFSRHYGFRYNYLFLFILFIGGYLVGAVLELVVWLVYGRKRNY